VLGGGGPSYSGRLLKTDIVVERGETVDLGTIDISADERADATP
jgi:hypothetical protein